MRTPVAPISDDAWQALKGYLAKLGAAESAAQLRAHVKAGRSKASFRYIASEYHRSLIACLDIGDEHGFKNLKLEQGYASAYRS